MQETMCVVKQPKKEIRNHTSSQQMLPYSSLTTHWDGSLMLKLGVWKLSYDMETCQEIKDWALA